MNVVPTTEFAREMARYNQWQNRSLFREANRLTDAQRKETRGAFFGSIHDTLAHILFGDQAWLFRFTGRPEHKPRAASIAESIHVYPDWPELERERLDFDRQIIAWADALDPAWLDGDLTWFSTAIDREVTRPKRQLVAHLFNHQTHHRGQVHCMLTQLGLKPDDTDLPFMPG